MKPLAYISLIVLAAGTLGCTDLFSEQSSKELQLSQAAIDQSRMHFTRSPIELKKIYDELKSKKRLDHHEILLLNELKDILHELDHVEVTTYPINSNSI